MELSCDFRLGDVGGWVSKLVGDAEEEGGEDDVEEEEGGDDDVEEEEGGGDD